MNAPIIIFSPPRHGIVVVRDDAECLQVLVGVPTWPANQEIVRRPDPESEAARKAG